MRYDSNGNAINQPTLTSNWVENRTKELLSLAWWNNYEERDRLAKEIGVKTEYAVCVAQSETWLWGHLKSSYNLWNCWNTDSWRTKSFSSFEEAFKIFWSHCINGTYLKHKTTLSHMYPNHKESICQTAREYWCKYVYASSPERAANNVMNCLGNIYQTQVNMDYEFRL